MRTRLALFALLCMLVLAGCGGNAMQQGQGVFRECGGGGLGELLKSDIDSAIEEYVCENFRLLKHLMVALYQNNPREWQKHGMGSMDAVVERVFSTRHNWRFPEIGEKEGAEAIHQALAPTFHGDRVLSFTAGVGTMLLKSYGYRFDYSMFDRADPQKLYDCARNLELAASKLKNAKKGKRSVALGLSDRGAAYGEVSAPTLLNRMVSNQDTLVRVLVRNDSRFVGKIIKRLPSAVFLPL